MLANDVCRCAGRIATTENGPTFVACADRERCRRYLERAHGRVFSSALRESSDAPCVEFIGESGDAGGREGCGTCNYRDEDCEMTKEQMSGLQPGNIVRGKSSGDAYVVTANYGDHVTAVRTVDLTNPGEWDLISGCGDFVEHPASKPRHA